MVIPTPTPKVNSRVVYAKGLAGRVKAVVAAVAPVFVALQGILDDGNVDSTEVANFVVTVVVAFGVYFAKNKTVPAQVEAQ